MQLRGGMPANKKEDEKKKRKNRVTGIKGPTPFLSLFLPRGSFLISFSFAGIPHIWLCIHIFIAFVVHQRAF